MWKHRWQNEGKSMQNRRKKKITKNFNGIIDDDKMRLARSKHSCTVPLGFGTITKLLHHPTV